MKTINNEKKELIHEAVKRLKGYERREYQAYIALEYFQGNARRTEYAMGWGREMLILGMKEIETGIRCIHRYKDTGRKRTEDKIETLSEDIRQIVDPQTQADPSMKSGTLTYTRATAKAVREALIKDKGTPQTNPTKQHLSNPHYPITSYIPRQQLFYIPTIPLIIRKFSHQMLQIVIWV